MAKSFQISARQISLDDSWDVIVVGGGPAGCAAAAAAGREGAKTLLIEQTACLGGMGTSGLVPAWTPTCDFEKVIYKGLAEQVFAKAREGVKHIKETDTRWVPIDPERLKRVYDDLVTQNGATVLFNTMLSSVEKNDDGVIDAILITNKAGLTAKKARVYVDCTGDADLCAWAGAEFHKGDDLGTPTSLMAATHCFVFSNVDEYAYRFSESLHPGNTHSPMYSILSSGKYPEIPDLHCCNNIIGPGTIGFNAGHVFGVDSTNPESVSQAMIKGRKIAAEFYKALKTEVPATFGNAYLVTTGSLLGIRESRRIVGDYTLTFDDYMDRRSFEDEICRNNYYIDVHGKSKEASSKNLADHEKVETRTFRYGKGESHGVPYRILTPKGLKNALVAGRCVSTTQDVQGSVRVMPCCLTMGEAAGMAAAMSAKSVGDVHKVDVAKLRARLRECGAYLP